MNDMTREQMAAKSDYVRDLIAQLDEAEKAKAPAKVYDRVCLDCSVTFQSQAPKMARCPPCRKVERERRQHEANEKRIQERAQRREAS